VDENIGGPLTKKCLQSLKILWKKELSKKDKVETTFLKEKIKLILKERDSTIFDETKFYDQWKEYYVDERCSIAHGKGSKLIDPRTIYEYDAMTRSIG
jgi:hypothetical protein